MDTKLLQKISTESSEKLFSAQLFTPIKKTWETKPWKIKTFRSLVWCCSCFFLGNIVTGVKAPAGMYNTSRPVIIIQKEPGRGQKPKTTQVQNYIHKTR